jgi:DNA polymerase-4
VSIDEAFMDLSGTARLHGTSPAKALAEFAGEVEKNLGITVSIGLSCNKFLAKIASDLDKPRGFAVLGRREATAFLAAKPVTLIFGVGKMAQQRFARDGLRTIGDLQRTGERELTRRYGTEGTRLARLSRGLDDRPVKPDREAKTISAETTFDHDIADFRPLELRLWQLCERVSARLKHNALAGSSLTLKLKTADFRIRTRARSLAHPTQLAARIFRVGRELLAGEVDGTLFRLIGIGVSTLCAADGADFADFIDRRAAEAEQAIDRLREKFGNQAVIKGLAFDTDDGERTTEDE